MTAPEVTVVLVSYGTRDLTLAALASVRRAGERIPLEAIVVDNASPDDSAEAVIRVHPWATVLRSPRNEGFAVAANRGARNARGRWLLFLIPDALLEKESLPRLLDAARSLARPGAVGPRILGPRGPEPSVGNFLTLSRDLVHFLRLDRAFPALLGNRGLFLRKLPAERTPVDWVTGACLLVPRPVFLDLGGFDEAYFMYVEDMDLCFRLRREGRTNLFVPDAVVRHSLGASPRGPGFLLEGGFGPEYFVRKFGIRYPWLLQRSRRVLGAALRTAVVETALLYRKSRGKDTGNLEARSRILRRTLSALLRTGAPPRPHRA